MITPVPPFPAAEMETDQGRTLAVADLHIGWEIALIKKGIHVPTQTSKLLKGLLELITIHKPDRLLILGDVKHTVATADMSEWRDVPDFFNELKKHVKQIDILRGNHDGNLEPLLPEGVNLLPANGVAVDNVGFFHGHQWPSPTLLACRTLVMGHVHPVISFRDLAGFRISRQVWVKARCDRTELTRVLLQKNKVKATGNPTETLLKCFNVSARTEWLSIMPSFNEFLGGRPLNEGGENERIVGPVLRSAAVDLENSEIYLLDGTFVGTLGQLKSLG